MKFIILGSSIFMLLFSICKGQSIELHYKYTSDNDSISFSDFYKSLNSKMPIQNIVSLSKEVNIIKNDIISKGFIVSNIYFNIIDSSVYEINVEMGEQYLLQKLSQGNIPDLIWNESKLSKQRKGEQILSEKNLKKDLGSILNEFENNGFPFARIQIDSIEFYQNKVKASLKAIPGPMIRIDSIIIKGSAKISTTFISSKIGLRSGDIYNENLIRKIDTRIKEVPFLSQNKTYDIFFTSEKADVILYLENKKASQFDGIVGLLSDNETGKISLTGEFKMKIINSFGQGEKLDFNWKSPGNLSQNLTIGISYPFIGGSPIGVIAGFSLYKKDTTYIDQNWNLGMMLRLSQGLDVKGFVEYNTSNLLSAKQFQFVQTLPDFADVENVRYGTGIDFVNLDYLFNPREGIKTGIEISAGNRTIKKNNQIPDIAYDEVDLITAQYKGWSRFEYYFPLKLRSTIKLDISGGGIFSDRVFNNELIRIGGLNSLRGFDEESILASAVSIGNLEYRYLFEENAYWGIFINAAWYEKNTELIYSKDTPWGFGSSLSLETALGIFSISYALGSEKNNPINFRGGKIHFGLINTF